MLYVIGLGLAHEQDISVRGLQAVRQCATVYLEAYTSVLMSASREDLEKFYGRPVIVADREMVESDSDAILVAAQTSDVAFLVVGDPFGATTHTDLCLRARQLRVPVHTIHNASVMNAVGACGVSLYNFGQTVSLVFFTETWQPHSFYSKIQQNRRHGLHTLLLLDIKVKEQSTENLARGRKIYEPPRYMSIATAAQQLLQVEDARGETAYDRHTPCVAVSRLGSDSQSFAAAPLGSLANYDAGPPLHSLVILGHQLHDLEVEYLMEFALDKDLFARSIETTRGNSTDSLHNPMTVPQ